MSWGSPILYFYFGFGSCWASSRLYLPGCITDNVQSLFSPSSHPPKSFLSSLLLRESGILFLHWPRGSVAGPAPPGLAIAAWIVQGPTASCRPFTSACVCWFVSRALLVREHPVNNCTTWTAGKFHCYPVLSFTYHPRQHRDWEEEENKKQEKYFLLKFTYTLFLWTAYNLKGINPIAIHFHPVKNSFCGIKF